MSAPSVVTVGLVSPLPPQLGGVATVARWLLDHEEDIGCRYVAFDLRRPVDEAGGRFRLQTLSNQLTLAGRFLLWARRAPSVVHCMISPTLIGLLRDVLYLGILTCFGRRTIAHVHVVRPDVHWWRLAMCTVGRLATEVIVLGTAAQTALDDLGVQSRVAPNAIPFTPAVIQDPIKPGYSGPFKLLFVGTFGERKGCHELIEAIAILRREGFDCRLNIVGREEYAGEAISLHNDVDGYRLNNIVYFLGQRAPEELPSLYADSDAFCLPSRLEGLPLALIEAMAYGLPVIATPVGCVEDLVIHGKTGLLAKVGDAISLSEQIGRLARDPALGDELRSNGSRHVAAHMGPDVVAKVWHDIYSSIDRMTTRHFGSNPNAGLLYCE